MTCQNHSKWLARNAFEKLIKENVKNRQNPTHFKKKNEAAIFLKLEILRTGSTYRPHGEFT